MTHWFSIFIAYTTLLGLGMLDNARGPFYPAILNDLQLDHIRGSLFFVTTSFTAFLGSAVAAPVVRRLDLIPAARLGIVLCGVGFYGVTLSRAYLWFLGMAGVFGLGLGLLNVVENLLVQLRSDARVRLRLLSGLHSIYALASLLAPELASRILAAGWTWQFGFQLIAATLILPLVLTFWGSSMGASMAVPEERSSPAKVLPPLPRWAWVSILFMAFYMVGEILLASRLVLFLVRDRGLSETMAPLFLRNFFFFLLIGRFFFTFVHWRWVHPRWIMATGLVLAILSVSAGLLTTPHLMSLAGLFMGPIFAMAVDGVSAAFPVNSPQVMSRAMAVGGLFIVAMHFFVGLIAEWYSLTLAMWLIPLFLLFALAHLLIWWRLSERALGREK